MPTSEFNVLRLDWLCSTRARSGLVLHDGGDARGIVGSVEYPLAAGEFLLRPGHGGIEHIELVDKQRIFAVGD